MQVGGQLSVVFRQRERLLAITAVHLPCVMCIRYVDARSVVDAVGPSGPVFVLNLFDVPRWLAM